MLKFYWKEFKQLLRGGMLPGILIMMPLMMMGLFPWAANMEMRNINVTVVDNDHSSYSSRLTGKVDASRYLHLESAAGGYGGGNAPDRTRFGRPDSRNSRTFRTRYHSETA